MMMLRPKEREYFPRRKPLRIKLDLKRFKWQPASSRLSKPPPSPWKLRNQQPTPKRRL